MRFSAYLPGVEATLRLCQSLNRRSCELPQHLFVNLLPLLQAVWLRHLPVACLIWLGKRGRKLLWTWAGSYAAAWHLRNGLRPSACVCSLDSAAALVKRGSSCGNSIFVGLPSQREVNCALRAGSFAWGGHIESWLMQTSLERPHPLHPFILEGGIVEHAYPLGIIPASGDSQHRVSVIFVAETDNKVLVAVPFQAWHRLRDRRLLPVNSMTKAALVQVPATTLESREDPLEELTFRLWVGFLSPQVVQTVEWNAEEGEADVAFDMDGSLEYLPYATGLMEVCQDHFAFHTAAEEAEGAQQLPNGESGLADLSQRVNGLETQLASLAQGMEQLLKQTTSERTTLKPSQPRVTFGSKPSVIPSVESECGGSSVASWSGRESPCRDGPIGCRSWEDEQDERTGPQEDSQSRAFVGNGGGVSSCRRVWLGSRIRWRSRPDAGCCDEAYSHHELPSRDQESNLFEQGGSRSGWSFRLNRTWRIWQWKKGSSCSEGPTGRTGRTSSRHFSHRREAHVGRLELADHDARCANANYVSTCLGGTQVQDRSLQSHSLHFMGSVRCFGLSVQERRCRSQGSTRPAAAPDRPSKCRPRRMGAGCRTFTGRTSAVQCAESACSSKCSRRRSPFQPSARSSVGRDLIGSFEGDRRLCEQTEEPLKAKEGGRNDSRPKEESQSQAESQGRGPSQYRRVTADPGGPEEPHFHVPGSRASTVHVASIVNSLPRWLLRNQCGFASFLRTIIQSPADRKVPATSHVGNPAVWPMALPYPEVFRGGNSDSSRHRKRLVCLQVALLDWLMLNRPRVAPRELRLGRKLSAKQWSAVQVLLHLAWDGNTPSEVDAASMGRAASKFESFEEEIAAVHRAAGDFLLDGLGLYSSKMTRPDDHFEFSSLRSGFLVGTVKRSATIAAKPVVADRLVFPGPPSFDPQEYLDEHTASLYNDPLSHAASPDSLMAPVPKVRVHADAANLVGLYKKLADSGRLQPVPSSCRRGPFVSGLFAVCKDLHRDRLILDARPPNLLERQQGRWTAAMASPSLLTDLTLADNEDLICSGEDLKDFFYQFRTTDVRTQRNILAEPLTLEQAAEVFGPQFHWHEPEVYVGLSTLAMGDTHACEFAQSSHLSICRRFGVMHDSELLTLRGYLPRSPLCIGIIIDDLVVLEKILRRADGAYEQVPCESDQRLDAALKGYAAASLEVNMKKEFRKQTLARFWGIEVDGRKGLARGSSLRLWPVLLITLRIAELGVCTVGLLEALAGSWIALLSLRRRMLCCMDVIFEVLAVSEQSAVLRLSDALVSELWTLALLGPLAAVNFRCRYADFLVATDSSSSWEAAVSADLAPSMVQEVCRRSLRKGIWTKLLPPSKAWMREHELLQPADEVPADSYSAHPLWKLLARALHYKFNWRQKIMDRRHINLTELEANLKSERRCASNLKHMHLLFALDSQVSLGALVKGRAASAALNAMLQRSLPWILGADLYGHYIYFPSPMNRADCPTRDREIDPPDVVLPHWWEAACNGDFADCDNWCDEQEAAVVEPEFDLAELDRREPVDLRTGRALHDECWVKAGRAAVPVGAIRAAAHDDCVVRSEATVEAESLHEEALAILRSFDRAQFFSTEKPLVLRAPGALDLYSGKFGVARQLARLGAPWVLTFEIERSSTEDLTCPALQKKLCRLLELKAVKILGAAIVCRSFSTAVTPPVRSMQFPRGKPDVTENMRRRLIEGNKQADNLAELLGVAEDNGIGFWFENPDLSWLWKQKKYKKFRSPASKWVWRFPFCYFGTRWKKPTRIGTCFEDLMGLRMKCLCTTSHLRLRGRSSIHKKSWTAVAQPYPLGLCKMIAKAAAIHAGWIDSKKLDIASCCKAGCSRIGEAANPGPRFPRRNRQVNLHDIRLRTPATEALEARQLERFLHWCAQRLQHCDVELIFSLCPEFLADALVAYGVAEFNQCGALSNYRHLILAVQRWQPSFKPFSASPWDIVAKWELSEPVNHRPPIPEVLVKSMCLLALQFGWRRWTGATLLAFYGCGRIGEVLNCSRKDLLFPEDALDVEQSAIFLQLHQFKSLHRQPARIQHMKIEHKQACTLLADIYYAVDDAALLYPGSPSIYRRRWDKLLSLLGIPISAKLTPGSLRGGAAVAAYKRGKPLSELLWVMRLRNLQTLESYLQKVAALGVLRDLSNELRRRLYAFSAVFDCLQPDAVRDLLLGQWSVPAFVLRADDLQTRPPFPKVGRGRTPVRCGAASSRLTSSSLRSLWAASMAEPRAILHGRMKKWDSSASATNHIRTHDMHALDAFQGVGGFKRPPPRPGHTWCSGWKRQNPCEMWCSQQPLDLLLFEIALGCFDGWTPHNLAGADEKVRQQCVSNQPHQNSWHAWLYRLFANVEQLSLHCSLSQ